MPPKISGSLLSALMAPIADATKVVDAPTRKELCTAIQTIDGAYAQLYASVVCPNHTVLIRFMGSYEPVCLRDPTDFKIADILQESPSNAGMHMSDIRRKAGIEERKLGRILRLLASNHIFWEG
ncbi:hypothetical protein K443DRAFT_170077 [Laccaria amethystina LaAM-08-1]|uniref:Uncharacterized protein n=1 Tax=Laccaria amethystina LaAM-08-1 TaxID=1095629 RepID=A0A0C9XRQ8_9AGAR|nr:hypothetical protein K443DRAFT_170077 [Laccaria amethystina LaAM-08-1]